MQKKKLLTYEEVQMKSIYNCCKMDHYTTSAEQRQKQDAPKWKLLKSALEQVSGTDAVLIKLGREMPSPSLELFGDLHYLRGRWYKLHKQIATAHTGKVEDITE